MFDAFVNFFLDCLAINDSKLKNFRRAASCFDYNNREICSNFASQFSNSYSKTMYAFLALEKKDSQNFLTYCL